MTIEAKLARCNAIARQQLERTGNEEETELADWTQEDGAILWHFAKTNLLPNHPAWGRYMRSLNA